MVVMLGVLTMIGVIYAILGGLAGLKALFNWASGPHPDVDTPSGGFGLAFVALLTGVYLGPILLLY